MAAHQVRQLKIQKREVISNAKKLIIRKVNPVLKYMSWLDSPKKHSRFLIEKRQASIVNVINLHSDSGRELDSQINNLANSDHFILSQSRSFAFEEIRYVNSITTRKIAQVFNLNGSPRNVYKMMRYRKYVTIKVSEICTKCSSLKITIEKLLPTLNVERILRARDSHFRRLGRIRNRRARMLEILTTKNQQVYDLEKHRFFVFKMTNRVQITASRLLSAKIRTGLHFPRLILALLFKKNLAQETLQKSLSDQENTKLINKIAHLIRLSQKPPGLEMIQRLVGKFVRKFSKFSISPAIDEIEKAVEAVGKPMGIKTFKRLEKNASKLISVVDSSMVNREIVLFGIKHGFLTIARTDIIFDTNKINASKPLDNILLAIFIYSNAKTREIIISKKANLNFRTASKLVKSIEGGGLSLEDNLDYFKIAREKAVEYLADLKMETASAFVTKMVKDEVDKCDSMISNFTLVKFKTKYAAEAKRPKPENMYELYKLYACRNAIFFGCPLDQIRKEEKKKIDLASIKGGLDLLFTKYSAEVDMDVLFDKVKTDLESQDLLTIPLSPKSYCIDNDYNESDESSSLNRDEDPKVNVQNFISNFFQ